MLPAEVTSRSAKETQVKKKQSYDLELINNLGLLVQRNLCRTGTDLFNNLRQNGIIASSGTVMQHCFLSLKAET